MDYRKAWRSKGVWALLWALLPGLAIASCGPAATATPASVKVQGTPTPLPPIKIGATYELTGSLGFLGTTDVNAAKAVIAKYNAEGGIVGRKIELVVMDNESKSDLAVSQLRRLTSDANIVAIMGPASLATSTPVLPVAAEVKVPEMTGVGQWELFQEGKAPYSFSSSPHLDVILGSYEYFKTVGITKVGMLLPSTATGQLLDARAPPRLKELGIELVGVEWFEPTTKDFTVPLSKLRAKGAQGIINPDSGASGAYTARDMKAMNWKGIMIGSNANLTPGFLETMGVAADMFYAGGVRTAVWKQLPTDDPARKLVEAFAPYYREIAGQDVGGTEARGFDQAYTLLEAIKAAAKAGGITRDAIKYALESQSGFQGVIGVYQRNAGDHSGLRYEDATKNYVMITGDPATKSWLLVSTKK